MNKLFLLALSFLIVEFSFTQTTILLEDFQSGMPLNWTLVDNDGNIPFDNTFNAAWITLPDPENETDTVAASTSYFTPAATADRWMITPALNLGAYGNFAKWNARSHDPSFPDSYIVLLSETNTDPESFTDTISLIQEEYFEWTTRTVDLSALGYNNQTVYLAFINNTYDGYKLYMDSIHVYIDDPSALEENELSFFEVYPNPATNEINIKTALNIQSVAIINENGQIVVSSDSRHLNVSNLSSGIYIVEVTTQNQERSRKRFVKLT